MVKENTDPLKGAHLVDFWVIVDNMLRGVKKIWKILLLVAALSVGVVFILELHGYVAMYRASAVVEVAPTNGFGVAADSYSASELAANEDSFAYIASSVAFCQEIASRLGYEDFLPATITASVVEGKAQLMLSVESRNPQLAYNVLTVAVEEFPSAARSVLGGISFTVMDGGSVPTKAYNAPAYARIVLKGLLAGIGVCVCILGLYGIMRFTVLRTEDLDWFFGLSCLGCVPAWKKKGKSKESLRADQKALESSFRTIRNHVMRLAEEENKKCFVVAGVQPEEGATTVAVNLALSLARKQKRVVLIDANFHDPAVAKALQMRPGNKDVASLLSEGELNTADFRRYGDLELFVLCGASETKEQLTFLDMDAVRSSLARLKDVCDYIIVDTASCDVFVDALQMGRSADSVILNIQQDGCSVYQIRYALEQLRGVGASVDGCVLSKFKKGVSGLRSA
jgi:receptor protein-tyrosine kinase